MIILEIDTTQRDEAVVKISIDGKSQKITSKNEKNSQAVLPLILKLLEKNSLSLKDINELKVNTGPGSFTGIRVGVSIANALASVLDIPINGKRKLVVPEYM